MSSLPGGRRGREDLPHLYPSKSLEEHTGLCNVPGENQAKGGMNGDVVTRMVIIDQMGPIPEELSVKQIETLDNFLGKAIEDEPEEEQKEPIEIRIRKVMKEIRRNKRARESENPRNPEKRKSNIPERGPQGKRRNCTGQNISSIHARQNHLSPRGPPLRTEV